MRILQVVTLLSPDGSYGGPARVALNQSAELIEQGHDVTVAAGTRGYPTPPAELDGIPVRLFTARKLVPRVGFAGVGAPALWRWFGRNRSKFDVVHIHFGRDLVVAPVAELARHHRVPYALQTHGMVVPVGHPLAPAWDTVSTRHVLRDAGAVFYLTEQERTQLEAVGRTELRLVQLGNGVPEYSPAERHAGPPEVLFAARMHVRKRPLAFVGMAKALLDAGVEARFTLVGPDEGEGHALSAALERDVRISWEGALAPAAVPSRMAAADVYVLPSVDEPYPMAVLEAMSVGLPVVVTNECGLAPMVRETNCGVVAEPEIPALAAATASILSDRSLAEAMGKRGRAAAQNQLGMQAVTDRLVDVYNDLIGSSP